MISPRGAAASDHHIYLVFDGGCAGGWAATAQEWMDSLANRLLGQLSNGVATIAEGICLADGYYTISCDPVP